MMMIIKCNPKQPPHSFCRAASIVCRDFAGAEGKCVWTVQLADDDCYVTARRE